MSGQRQHLAAATPAVPADLSGLTWRPGRGAGAHSAAVEACRTGDGRIAVRLTRSPAGPALIFTPRQWAAFAPGGEFDVDLT